MSPFMIPIVAMMIPITAILAGAVFKPWLEFKRRQLELASTTAAEKAARYAARTEQLKQRVRVLECIVTDRGTALASEIDQLRDAPATAIPPLN